METYCRDFRCKLLAILKPKKLHIEKEFSSDSSLMLRNLGIFYNGLQFFCIHDRCSFVIAEVCTCSRRYTIW